MQHWILTLFIITTCMASYAACARQATETPPLASGVYNFQGAPFDNWTLVGLQDPRVTGLDIYCTWSELEPSAGAPRWDWLERTCEPWWSRGKQVALRVSTGGHRAQGTPEWVFQKGVRRITAGAPFADFERDTDGFELMSGASRTETASPPAAGKAVIRAARRGAFLLSPANWGLPAGETVTVTFDVRCVRSGRLMLLLRAPSGKSQPLTSWMLRKGRSGPLEHTFRVPHRTGMRVQWELDQTAHMDVDNVLLTRRWDCPESYPVYWQPAFRAQLESLVQRLAVRYAGKQSFAFFSVNGIGRWDEAMLNTGDAWNDDSLKRQWLAQGYTPEGYLDHLIWAMDLWRRCFPGDHLALMTAYGFNDPDWTPWLWYRMSEEAAKRGIHIQQNGWSGKYSQWHNSFQFSWAPARLGVRPIYEPGGGPSGMDLETTEGYMLRGLLDNSTILTWYAPDLRDSAQQGGIDLAAMGIGHRWNTWFARLRPYSVSYHKRPDRVTSHRNLFLGITQFQDPDWLARSLGGGGGAGIYEQTAGEWALRTDIASGNRYLYLDLDDRAVWAGLRGASLAIRYLDRGIHPFTVEGYDHQQAQWRTLFVAPRRNTGKWLVYRILLPDWTARHPMDLTNNEWKDLRITASDEDVSVTDLQLQFLKDADWREAVVQETRPTDAVRRLKPGEAMQVTLDRPDGLVSSIHVPIWRPDRSACTVELEVRDIETRSQPVVWQFAMASDGEWLRVPWPTAARSACVSLRVVSGEAGWRLAATGQPAWRSCRWQVEKTRASDATEITPFNNNQAELHIKRPWCGLEIRPSSGTHLVARARLERWLGSWQAVADQLVPFEPAGSALIASGPLPAGHYRLILETTGADRPQSDLAAGVRPVYLLPVHADTAAWDGAQQAHGFTIARYVCPEHNRHNGSWEIPLSIACHSVPGSQVVFRITNGSPAPVARLFWRGESEVWDVNRSVDIPVLPDDMHERTYTARLPKCQTPITAMRLELMNMWPESGQAALHWLELRDPPLLTAEWNGTERLLNGEWMAQFGLQEMTPDKTGWRGQWRGDLGGVRAVNCLITGRWRTEADASQIIRLKWTPPAGATGVSWRWIHDGVTHRVAAPVMTHGRPVATLLPVGTTPGWTGDIDTQQVALLGWPPDGVPADLTWTSAELMDTKPVIAEQLHEPVALIRNRTQCGWRPGIAADPGHMLRLNLEPETDAGAVRVRWKTTSGADEQTVSIYKGISVLWLPVGEHPKWRGRVVSVQVSAADDTSVTITGWGLYTGQAVETRSFGPGSARGDLAGWTVGGIFHSPRVPATGGLRVSATDGGIGWFEHIIQAPSRRALSPWQLRVRVLLDVSGPVQARLVGRSEEGTEMRTAFLLQPDPQGWADTRVRLAGWDPTAGALRLRLEVDLPHAADCTLEEIVLDGCDGYTSGDTTQEDQP